MYRFLSIFLIIGGLAACSKHDDILLYSSYYHQDADTIYSAIHIPNSFTPDGDGMNDMFYPSMNGITNYSFAIYDRSNIVFETNDLNECWNGISNGIMQANGIYSYTISATDYTGYKYDIEGFVHLML